MGPARRRACARWIGTRSHLIGLVIGQDRRCAVSCSLARLYTGSWGGPWLGCRGLLLRRWGIPSRPCLSRHGVLVLCTSDFLWPQEIRGESESVGDEGDIYGGRERVRETQRAHVCFLRGSDVQ